MRYNAGNANNPATRNSRRRWLFWGWVGRLKHARSGIMVQRYGMGGIEIQLDLELEEMAAKINADITNLIALAEKKAEAKTAIINLEPLPKE